MHFKNLEGSLRWEARRGQYLLASRLGLLQMVSEQDIGQCVSEKAEPQRRWTRGSVPARKMSPEGGGL